MDLPEIPGAAVVMRAAVDGGLVSLGDAHLAQGDAEIHRSAVECQADVRLRILRRDPDEAAFSGLPQVNTAAELGKRGPRAGASGGSGEGRLRRSGPAPAPFGSVTLPEAYRLLGAAGTVRVGQVVPPVYSAMAKIERRYVGESDQ